MTGLNGRKFLLASTIALLLTVVQLPSQAAPPPTIIPPSEQFQLRFDPKCGADRACQVWTKFRSEHPFPYQTLAGAPTDDGALAIIISEPPPTVSKPDLEALVRAEFGSDLLSYGNRRWMIGADGWLEDVVLKVKAPKETKVEDFLKNRGLHNRIGLLYWRLFGTTFGGVLEDANLSYRATAQASAPDIAATPAELREWVTRPTAVWTELDGGEGAAGYHLDELLTRDTVGSFMADDRQLVILTMPAAVVAAARKSDGNPGSWLLPFRTFAVATDAVLGSIWTEDGGIVLVGQSRRHSQAAIPPLRFETFCILLREKDRELQQSYERNNLFSGRLAGGPYHGRDWAPILLSRSLIDTEFGALLNITDQFLKSWSEAGAVKYLYFDYPLRPDPEKFVFGAKRLDEMVKRETQRGAVLFNWNTAGAAVSIRDTKWNVLAAGRTSALPVTYGAGSLADSEKLTKEQMRKLQDWEDEAYSYFATRRDPNLARVVSYTLIYQSFQGARRGAVLESPEPTIPARAKAVAAVALEAERLLAAMEIDKEAPPKEISPVDALNILFSGKPNLELFYSKHNSNRSSLAVILADPRGGQSKLADALANIIGHPVDMGSLEGEYNAELGALAQTENELQGPVKTWLKQHPSLMANSQVDVETIMLSFPPDLQRRVRAVKAEKEALKAFRERLDAFGDAEELSEKLNRVVGRSMPADPEIVRSAYEAENASEPDGRIKTPSIVVSSIDQGGGTDGVGGHNLTAKTLQIVVDPSATVARVERSPTGLSTLHVPPSQADKASAFAADLARLLEHEKATDAELIAYLAKAPDKPLRPVDVVLDKPIVKADALRCAFTCTRSAAPSPRGDYLDQSLQQDGSLAAALVRDEQGYLIAARRLSGKVECCVRFVDTASMYDFVRTSLPRGDIAVFGERKEYVDAIIDGARTGDYRDAAVALASDGGDGGVIVPPGNRLDSFHYYEREPRPSSGNSGHGGGGDDGIEGHGPDGEGPKRLLALIGEQRDAPQIHETYEGARAEERWRALEDAGATADAAWVNARDGEKFIIRRVWQRPGGDVELDIVAGSDPAHRDAAKATLLAAVAEADKAPYTIGSFYQRVRLYVTQTSGRGGVKRLIGLIKDNALKYRIATDQTKLRGGLKG